MFGNGMTLMQRVVIESPFALDGEIERNVTYARRAVSFCVHQGMAPIASHLLFTQEGILDDNIPAERKLGMGAGFAWLPQAERVLVFCDYGIGPGMYEGIGRAHELGIPITYMKIGKNDDVGKVLPTVIETNLLHPAVYEGCMTAWEDSDEYYANACANFMKTWVYDDKD